MILYYAVLFGSSAVFVFASQKYSRSTKSYYDIFIYALITGIMGCGFFASAAGFRLSFNLPTAMYAAFYAAAAFISYFTSIPIYRYMGIAEANVCKSCLSLSVTTVSGYILFSEKITPVSVVRLILMIMATVAVYFDKKNGDNSVSNTGRAKKIGILLCIVAAFGGVLSTVNSKAFAADKNVSDTNSYLFLTNVIIVAVSALTVLIIKFRGKAASDSSKLKLWQYGIILVTTLTSNIGSILQVLILETGDVSMYAPLSGALNLLAAQTVSVFTKEKPKLVPLILAISALLIGIFE